MFLLPISTKSSAENLADFAYAVTMPTGRFYLSHFLMLYMRHSISGSTGNLTNTLGQAGFKGGGQ